MGGASAIEHTTECEVVWCGQTHNSGMKNVPYFLSTLDTKFTYLAHALNT